MSWSREEKLAAYEGLIAGVADIERKGATMPYTSLNGNMFSFLSADGVLAFRFSKAARDSFLAAYPGSEVEQHGRVMKDYVAIPDSVLEDGDELRRMFETSVAEARTLKPKATTRKT